MNKNKLKRSVPFLLVLIFILGWTVLLILKKPGDIVDSLGVKNSYFVAFLVSMMGAFSSFTTFSSYPAIITLAAGKVNPFILGVVAGIGLSIGDILFYYFGFTIRRITSDKWKEKLTSILKRLMKKPEIVIQLFIFIYVGFTPFPNNVLTGTLSLTGYPFRKVVLPLVLGDIALPVLISYLTYKGVDIL